MIRGSSIAIGALLVAALLFSPAARAQDVTILCLLPHERREETVGV